jgi:DNA polymerase-3 subunit delta
VATRTPVDVRKQIAAGDTDPIYLLQGDDDVERSALGSEFAELVEEGLRAFNVETIHAGQMTTGDQIADGIAAILDAARTLPMMAPRRVVVVAQAQALLAPKRDSEAAGRALDELLALLEKPEPLTTLVFVSATLDKRTKVSKAFAKNAIVVGCGSPVDVAGAERWVRARLATERVDIDPAGARALAARAGFPERPRNDGKTGDLKQLRGDADRLLLYAFGQKKISIDDVRAVVGPAALQDEWALPNAIEAGQGGEALRQLALVFDAGARPEQILGQLAWMVRAKFPQVAPQQLESAVDALFRTDIDLKSSGGDPRVLLERLVVELCEGKRTRTGFGPRRW